MKLKNKKLILVSITRQSLFDANYIACCDNCGKAIINIANVKDSDGKSYSIGLDCKKKLIDKPIIDTMLNNLYNIKHYKQRTSEAEKFLKFCAYPDIDIKIDNDVIIYDRLPHEVYEGMTGNIIYYQDRKYLQSIGLTDFLNKLNKTL